MSDLPCNHDQPVDVPLRPGKGRYLVIARLVWADRVEYVPVTANRWTRTHVLVTRAVQGPDGRAREEMIWLRACDVRRLLVFTREPGPA